MVYPQGSGGTASCCCSVCMFGAEDKRLTQWPGSSFVFTGMSTLSAGPEAERRKC